MLFRQFVDPKLAQYAYLVGCQKTGEALLIDPQRDIDRYLEAAEAEGLRITSVADTHIHADFLSGVREFAERFGTRVYLSGEGGDEWSSPWARDERYDAHFLKDGDTFRIGRIEVKAVHTPGHTPEHLSYLVIDRGGGASTPMGVATGDFVFVGDLGRPDLLEQAAGMHGVQEPAARQLYRSLTRFHDMEDHLQVWPAHGAGSACGKALGAVPQTTVGYEKLYNPSLRAAERGEDAFVDAILEGQPEPQTYFARMKRQNNEGVPLLGDLPRPRRLTAAELGRMVEEEDVLVVDTRLDRSAFMARHIPGALLASLNRAFNTAVGSLVEDEATPLLLIVEEARVEEAVRDLVRIGYDDVRAFATPDVLTRYFQRGGRSATIPEADFKDVARLRDREDVTVVDVRFANEFAEGHVPGAVNASYTRLPSYLGERIPRGKTLLVHCASGGRSAAAASYLAGQGLDVRFVGASFSEYRKFGEVVTSGDPAAV